MSRLRQCKFYSYDNGLKCEKGVALKRYTHETAPCFPRNARRPCAHREWITQEDIDAEEAELEKRFCGVFKARKLILETGKDFGQVECPECRGKLRFHKSGVNGHIRAACEKPGCIRWME